MNRWPRLLEGVVGLCFLSLGGVLYGALGLVAVGLAVASARRPDRHLHLWGLIPALLPVLLAFLHPDPPPPVRMQLGMLCGLTWALLAILPTRAAEPPRREV